MQLAPNWEAFADWQYRHVDYNTNGINDKFYKMSNGLYSNQGINIDKKYDFFNPKAGFTFHQDGHRAYISIAYAGREPERNNFTDNGKNPAPKAEKLVDYELGYHYSGSNWHFGANFYYMDYKDQFVQTGQLSDIGENLTVNISKSHRLGVELTAIGARCNGSRSWAMPHCHKTRSKTSPSISTTGTTPIRRL
jgi:iron complex outermembrane receptor protein